MGRFFALGTLLGLLALAACAAQEEAPFPGRAAAPAPAAAPEAKPAWQEEWERLLAAAKQEGKVAVLATARDAPTRRTLSEGFEKKHGITVDFFPAGGAELAPRIRTERQAGQYLWDVYVGGISTMVNSLKPMRALDPLEPTFILPEVKDPKNWAGGQLPFADKDRLAFMFSMSTTDAFKINTNLAKPEEFKSYRDLLDPKWKGKIMAMDPRLTSNVAEFQFYYLHKELGPDFIRALAKQDLVILRDERVSLEWLAQGRNPILIGGSTSRTVQMAKEGVPVHLVDPKQMREGGYVTAGPGGLGLVNRAPHPNAARVYINWLLTRETQTEFSKTSVRHSRRPDVPTEHIDAFRIAKETFIVLDQEERLAEREKVAAFAREVFGSQ